MENKHPYGNIDGIATLSRDPLVIHNPGGPSKEPPERIPKLEEIKKGKH